MCSSSRNRFESCHETSCKCEDLRKVFRFRDQFPCDFAPAGMAGSGKEKQFLLHYLLMLIFGWSGLKRRNMHHGHMWKSTKVAAQKCVANGSSSNENIRDHLGGFLHWDRPASTKQSLAIFDGQNVQLTQCLTILRCTRTDVYRPHLDLRSVERAANWRTVLVFAPIPCLQLAVTKPACKHARYQNDLHNVLQKQSLSTT